MQKPYLLIVFTCLLLTLNVTVWSSVLFPKPALLEVAFLDVGQGDAVLIQTPSGVDVLIDGGPDRSVLRQLPKELGIFDRTIDVVIATHPDKDHIAGLPEVFDRYHVRYYFAPGVSGESSFADALRTSVREEPGIQTIMPQRGMRISLGDGVYADILFPDRDVSGIESNDASTALRLVYGDTSFLFTGDLAAKTETYLVALDGRALKSTVLKAGHHGSKSSTSEVLLAAVQPDFFVVSAGEGNSYGHPAPDVIERARAVGATILSTIDEGTVRLKSDGRQIIQD